MVNKRYLPVYIIYSIEREGENVGSGVFCMPFDSFANNVFLAKGNEQQVDSFIYEIQVFRFRCVSDYDAYIHDHCNRCTAYFCCFCKSCDS